VVLPELPLATLIRPLANYIFLRDMNDAPQDPFFGPDGSAKLGRLSEPHDMMYRASVRPEVTEEQ
jgi:hypothetical protein